MADIQAVTDAIAAGDYDDDLITLIVATKDRVNVAQPSIYWRIRFGDLEVTEQNLTFPEVAAVEKLLRDDVALWRWGQWHPARSATEMLAILKAVLMAREGLDAAAADARLGELTAEKAAGMVDSYTSEPDGSP